MSGEKGDGVEGRTTAASPPPSALLLPCSFLPPSTSVIGYARTEMTADALRERLRPFIEKASPAASPADVAAFLGRVSYVSGAYETAAPGWGDLAAAVEAREGGGAAKAGAPPRAPAAPRPVGRLVYLALPPSVYPPVLAAVKARLTALPPSPAGCPPPWIRVVIEKPFGRDLASSEALSADVGALFGEESIYRIDHYLGGWGGWGGGERGLWGAARARPPAARGRHAVHPPPHPFPHPPGKELMQNMLVLRFSNTVLAPAWSRDHVASVQITFKEPFGTEGRGGYFDEVGGGERGARGAGRRAGRGPRPPKNNHTKNQPHHPLSSLPPSTASCGTSCKTTCSKSWPSSPWTNPSPCPRTTCATGKWSSCAASNRSRRRTSCWGSTARRRTAARPATCKTRRSPPAPPPRRSRPSSSLWTTTGGRASRSSSRWGRRGEGGGRQFFLFLPRAADGALSPTARPHPHTPPPLPQAGKALNERAALVRIQFRAPARPLLARADADRMRNEIVVRLQPDEAIYMKVVVKQPGLESGASISELDLDYKSRYGAATYIPEAYERLLLDAVRGDASNFVRRDELRAGWAVFDDLLAAADAGRFPVHPYPAGSRGPPEADALAARHGYVRNVGYEWKAGGERKKGAGG